MFKDLEHDTIWDVLVQSNYDLNAAMDYLINMNIIDEQNRLNQDQI